MTSAVFVRRETVGDADAIRHVHHLAFGNDADTFTWEARLVDDLRTGTSWIPALSIERSPTALVSQNAGSMAERHGRSTDALDLPAIDRTNQALGDANTAS